MTINETFRPTNDHLEGISIALDVAATLSDAAGTDNAGIKTLVNVLGSYLLNLKIEEIEDATGKPPEPIDLAVMYRNTKLLDHVQDSHEGFLISVLITILKSFDEMKAGFNGQDQKTLNRFKEQAAFNALKDLDVEDMDQIKAAGGMPKEATELLAAKHLLTLLEEDVSDERS